MGRNWYQLYQLFISTAPLADPVRIRSSISVLLACVLQGKLPVERERCSNENRILSFICMTSGNAAHVQSDNASPAQGNVRCCIDQNNVEPDEGRILEFFQGNLEENFQQGVQEVCCSLESYVCLKEISGLPSSYYSPSDSCEVPQRPASASFITPLPPPFWECMLMYEHIQ